MRLTNYARNTYNFGMQGVIFIDPLMSLRDVRKVYRVGNEKVVALNSIDLDIEKGEICCILGTSGSGKSTLLNLMAGLERPTRGNIKIKGKPIEKMSENALARFRRKNIGFVFQSYNLIPTLTAMENVSLPLIFMGIDKKVRNVRARGLLKQVGLDKHIRHKPNQMSGGQQQRVGIARAFIGNPEVVFADELTGNLDSKTSADIMNLITKITRENNQTLVIVTHDINMAKYADRIVYITDGSIEKSEKAINV